MKCRSRPDSIQASRIVILVPSSAVVVPYRMLGPLLYVSVEGICNILSWHPALDSFILHFVNDLHDIVRDGMERSHDAAVLDGPRRTDAHQEIGHGWNS